MNILITGGTSGIGRSLVERFSEKHNVVFVGRNQERGKEIAEKSGAKFIAADLSDVGQCVDAVSKYFELFSTCDVLINNAGLWSQGKVEETSNDEIKDVFEINTISPIIITKEVLTRIKRNLSDNSQSGARIIFVNSQLGLIAKAERAVYISSKWAITGFARSLAAEVASDNIGVTNLSPSFVDTGLFDHGGYPRETTGAISPEVVSDAVEYVISTDPSVSIPELAVKPTLY